ncbi:MAG: nuclear transport factor 2 family protein [Gammaproteobacteria bacterium]|nr:nuclear transport factor 2 family protein [Gammaproteobacteria bacterium]MDH5734686.1 nuclear transport factor 2 family protein [Gammaproteobacteria bacterium]
MTNHKDIQQWINDLFNSIDNKNNEKFSSYLSDDVRFRFGNMPVSTGKSTVEQQVSQFFTSIKSLQHEITEFWQQNNTIICHGRVCYTRHDNSTLSVPFSNIFKLNNQRISDYLIFVDVSELY